MNLLDLVSKHVQLRKASNCKGGEWQGPCPWCGGNDRFHVWPNQNEGQGGYWCRSCDRGGDAIQFLRDFEGKTFQEACDFLNIRRDEKTYAPPAQKTKPEFQPVLHQSPADLWQEKAEKFVIWAQERLTENKEAMAWLADRGIDAAAAETYRLGWNPGENGKDIFRQRKAWGLPELKKEDGRPRALLIPRGLVIPKIDDGVVQRIRVRRPEAHRTTEWPTPYYIIPGSSMGTMIIGIGRPAYVIIESELDGIACASACDLAGACALGMLEGKPDAAAYAILQGAVQILNALDYGDTGGGQKASIRANAWWKEHFGDKCDRWPVPHGKDPGDAYKAGVNLNRWIRSGLAPIITINDKPSDQKTAPAPTSQAAASPAEAPQRSGGIQTEKDIAAIIETRGLSPLILELWKLLRTNPAVRIYNDDKTYSVLRNGKPVGGRINQLVFREQAVMDYILGHGANVIDAKNLINIATNS